MNRSRYRILLVAVLTIISFAGSAWAVPITLKEVFLGGKTDDNNFSIFERSYNQIIPGTGNKARFSFDLTGLGGMGQLFSGNTPVGGAVSPTRDETAYDLTAYQTPYMAYVDFFISDYLFELTQDPREKVRINIESGGIVKNKTFALEDSNGSKRVRVDLAQEGMLDLLADGELLAMAIGPAFGNVVNSFTLDRVVLYAEADTIPAPVPEPATMLLLGSGIVGIAAAKRKRRRELKS